MADSVDELFQFTERISEVRDDVRPGEIPKHDLVVVQTNDEYRLAEATLRDENFLPHPETMKLSGHGIITDLEKCGKIIFMYSSGNKFKPQYHRCGKQGCELCFRSWARTAADKAAGYLWGMKDAVFSGQPTDLIGRLYHIVISPDPNFPWDKEQAESQINIFMNGVHKPDSAGVGWALTYHPGRIRCAVCGHKPKDRSTEHVAHHCPECQTEYPWEWFDSPHFHLISNLFVKDFKLVKQYEDAFHFKFVNVSQDGKKAGGPGYIHTREVLEAILAYEFGHAEFIEGKHAIRYFGMFSPKKWRKLVSIRDTSGAMDYRNIVVVEAETKRPYYRIHKDYVNVNSQNGTVIIPMGFYYANKDGTDPTVNTWEACNINQQIPLTVRRFRPVLTLRETPAGIQLREPEITPILLGYYFPGMQLDPSDFFWRNLGERKV